MMKTMVITSLLGFSLAVQAAELNVWSSIPPLMSVARAVGGDRASVSCFMTGSQDPHTFSPSPKTVARAREADLFLTVGMEFETTIQDKLSRLNPSMETLNLAADVEHQGDLHVWLSLPLLAQMADNLTQVLTRLDPDGASVYRANLKNYQDELMDKHRKLTARLAPLRGTVFYVYHPAFYHFAADYGLKQEAVEVDGKTPSPKQLLALIRRAREENVQVIFVQPQFDNRSATIIAERIGGRVAELNQLEEDPVVVIQKAADEIERALSQP